MTTINIMVFSSSLIYLYIFIYFIEILYLSKKLRLTVHNIHSLKCLKTDLKLQIQPTTP